MVGHFISEDLSLAMAEVLKRTHLEEYEHDNKKQLQHAKSQQVEEEKVPYLPIKEINLDDNGMKDAAFANILRALSTQPTLKRISYVNNEIGAKSIEQL